MKLRIKIKKNPYKLLIGIILYYTMFIGFFTYNFSLPNYFLYFGDLLCIILFLASLKKINRLFNDIQLRKIIYLIFLLLIIGTISALVSGFNFSLWLWAFRNWGRLFFYFLLCVVNLDLFDVDDSLNFVKNFIHINTLCVIFQYLFLRDSYAADAINGFFGRNTSGLHITMLLVICIIVFSSYFNKRIKTASLITYIVEICICSALAELKAVFVFILVFLVFYILANTKANPSKILKYGLIIVIALLLVYGFATALGNMYPEFKDFLKLENLISSGSSEYGYGNSGYIDRLNGISVINKYFFNKMGLKYKLFGIGMGNGEYSSFSRFTSSFYRNYGIKFFYLNFALSDLYLEVGLIGLVLYILIFVSIALWCFKSIKKNLGDKYYMNLGYGFALLSLIFIIYNNLQRTDISFVLAYFLSVPFIYRKSKRENNVG